MLNYVVLGTFVASFTFVLDHYRNGTEESISSMFVPIIILWSVCLAYFFGFFGIAFLDKDVLVVSTSSAASDDLSDPSPSPVPASAPRPALPKSITAHNPPICSDKTSKGEKVVSFAEVKPDTDYNSLSDEEIMAQLFSGALKDYQLESKLEDRTRAVALRRSLFENLLGKSLEQVPYLHYDYNKVFGANCEIVVGYVPIPIGMVGPLAINGEDL